MAIAVDAAPGSSEEPAADGEVLDAYPEERALTRAVANRDRVACDRFARRLLPTVRRVARGLLRGRDEAKDATQIALLDLLQAAPNYAGRGPLEAWAQRIAARSTLRWVRKQRKIRERTQQHEAAQDRRQITLDTQVVESLPRPLSEYLAELSEVQREALLLRHALGHTIPEIAKITEAAVPTVKSRIQKGHLEVSRLIRRDLNLGARRPEE
jgi:RNA polymerase sigma-70 factor (ECF subfamily)